VNGSWVLLLKNGKFTMRKIQNHNFDFRVRKVALHKNSYKDEPFLFHG
jgi:hypothetical protein